MADTEIWRDIEGFENLYQISNQGNVRSLRFGKIKILKPQIWRGYRKIQLHKNKMIKTFTIHVLVARAFIPNPENKPCIDHIIPISRGGTDYVENLRWVTSSENNSNPLNLEKNEKPVLQFNLNGEFIKKWKTAKSAGETNNIFPTSITACCRGRLKTAGGFIWKYAS